MEIFKLVMKQVESYTNTNTCLILCQLTPTIIFCPMAVLLRKNQNLHLRMFLWNESFTYLSDNNVIGIFDSLLLSEAVPCI